MHETHLQSHTHTHTQTRACVCIRGTDPFWDMMITMMLERLCEFNADAEILLYPFITASLLPKAVDESGIFIFLNFCLLVHPFSLLETHVYDFGGPLNSIAVAIHPPRIPPSPNPRIPVVIPFSFRSSSF